MTAVTKFQNKQIENAMNNIYAKIIARGVLSMEELFNLYWTPEQHAKIKEVERLCAKPDRNLNAVFSGEVTLPDTLPLPEDFNRTVKLDFKARSDGYSGLVPIVGGHMLQSAPAEAREAYQSALVETATKAYERSMWKWLMDKRTMFSSHEEFRYVFPGYVYILRRAGLTDLASKIEEVKRAYSTSWMDAFDRQRLKYLNTWFATHMLLDTFNRYDGELSYGYCTIRLYGDQVKYCGEKVVTFDS